MLATETNKQILIVDRDVAAVEPPPPEPRRSRVRRTRHHRWIGSHRGRGRAAAPSGLGARSRGARVLRAARPPIRGSEFGAQLRRSRARCVTVPRDVPRLSPFFVYKSSFPSNASVT